jgi:hypothetical protein
MKLTKNLMTAMVATAVMALSAASVKAETHGAKIFVIGGKADDRSGRRSKKAPTTPAWSPRRQAAR